MLGCCDIISDVMPCVLNSCGSPGFSGSPWITAQVYRRILGEALDSANMKKWVESLAGMNEPWKQNDDMY